MKEVVKISVREIIEFVLAKGDLESGFISNSRALEGIRLHKKIQEENSSIYENFEKEVVLSSTFEYDDLDIFIDGRADGIIIKEKKIIIEEIKSTRQPFLLLQEEVNEFHYAQVAFYGYFYCLKNSLSEIILRITYINVDTEEVMSIDKKESYEKLKEYVECIVNEYKPWAEYKIKHEIKKKEFLRRVRFPFDEYRKGQRELAINVYTTEKEGGKAFIQAPTGIGKTVSTIFPSLKCIGEGFAGRLFYLTAKTITRSVAEEAFKIIMGGESILNVITITAKEKVCCNEEKRCDGRYCEYAKSFYSKVKLCTSEILEDYNGIYDRETIEYYGEKYKVCPFELTLFLANWCDVIIGDYNYVFDPMVALSIAEEKSEKNIFLIDEAHNLVDRSREMYSINLNSNIIDRIKSSVGKVKGKIEEYIKGLESYMNLLKDEMRCYNEKHIFIDDGIKELMIIVRKILVEIQALIINKRCKNEEEVLEIYFELNKFLTISALYGEGFRCYANYIKRNEMEICVYCINPSKYILMGLKKAKASIIFSATLSPVNYYKELLLDQEECRKIKYGSPFDEKNLKVLMAPISTKYVYREKNKNIVAEYIYNFISRKVGNYIIFFPSYNYMKMIEEEILREYPDVKIIKQSVNMSEVDRDGFISKFENSPKETLVAFCVLGGLFSEGIDLVGEKLIGTIIVGVGIPQINLNNNLIKEYYDEKENKGYNYAYTFPGMNKVIQGVGRVIRTKSDKGMALLIDDRYGSLLYENLIPDSWKPVEKVTNIEEMNNKIMKFWNE